MGSPCEVLSEAKTEAAADEITSVAASEAWRIEDKFSRYRADNVVDRINSAEGACVEVDEETARLLDFAVRLHSLSNGMFDITSGILRRVWTFDGGSLVPSEEEVRQVLGGVGWHKARWDRPVLQLQAGVEIDFGGIGKEYAVDRAVMQLREMTDTPCLVNFGGDLAVTGPPRHRPAWSIGIDGSGLGNADNVIKLSDGALATSGDSRRFIEKDGIRYSHVLDPHTGWPVRDAAASITVAADTCTQAGMLSTLAMLRGGGAEAFLSEQNEQYWCRR